jgi:hypothetical protein
MPVKLTIDNKSTDHFSIKFDFDLDALKKVGPCEDDSAPDDVEGDDLIADFFKQWCDHKASVWASVVERASIRVELAEAAHTLDGEVIGPVPINEEVV